MGQSDSNSLPKMNFKDMKAILRVVGLLLIISACNSQPNNSAPGTGVKISGKVNNKANGDIILEGVVDQQFKKIQSIKLNEDNTFSFDLPVSEANLYRIPGTR